MGGPQWRTWDALKQEIEEDEFLKKTKGDVTLGAVNHNGFSIQQGLLMYKDSLVIPRTSKMIPMIFEEFHGAMQRRTEHTNA